MIASDAASVPTPAAANNAASETPGRFAITAMRSRSASVVPLSASGPAASSGVIVVSRASRSADSSASSRRSAARHQIIDQHSDVRVVTSEDHRLGAADPAHRVDAGDDALARCLFVARRAVDLAGKEEVLDGLYLE